MHLQLLDWVIIVASLAVCFVPALFFGKRAGKTTSEFFASGRAVPWWLAGVSMVATTFSSDTPNLVTNFVRTQGVAGNWQWWAFVLTGISTVFFYAQLWRRSGVLTDLEFYELRYSGKAASVVRGFRAIYLGFFFNCIIMAGVNLAACKIAGIMFGLDRWQTLLFIGLLNVVFAAHSGLWGVLVIDLIQFVIKMSACIAAAYFAVKLPEVGGLHGMVEKLSAIKGPDGLNYLSLLPDFSNMHWGSMAIAVFVMPLAIQWWAVWYPGAEPGGGSYIAQRMLASKSEKDALGSVLFFNVAHYCLRPWPWILVGLCSILVYPQLSDIQKAFPNMDKSLLGHDIAYPAMLRFLPVGWLGLMVAGLIAANSSTILTHLNWGASYLVHDMYRRFIRPNATEHHYVTVGRIATVAIFIVAAGLTYCLNDAKETFGIMLQIGAGTGLIYLLRWFWWRINAWCEVVAMISSFAVSIAFLVLTKNYGVQIGADAQKTLVLGGVIIGSDIQLLLTVIVTTICWVITAFIPGLQTDRAALIDFYKKVQPFGPGWQKIRDEIGPEIKNLPQHRENIPLALLGWVVGCTMIWSTLFAVGNYLYGRMLPASILLGVAVVTCIVLIGVISKIWSVKPQA